MMLMWPWILIERESYWRWVLRTGTSQCHSNPVFFPNSKPPDPMKDLYEGQTYDLKTRLVIWKRMDVVTLEYGKSSQIFHLTICFFQFITGDTFKYYYVMWLIIALLV